MAIENLREIGNILYEKRADGVLYPVRRIRPDVAPQGVKPQAPGLLAGTGIDEKLAMLNKTFNPVEAIGQSMSAGERMMSPDVQGWDRVAALGDMLSGVAGVAAPVAALARTGAPAATAVMEGLLGWSPTREAAGDMARQFSGSEYGGMKVYTGGYGDPIKAASERGAWFSETPDLAMEYAGQGGRVLSAEIDPRNPIMFRHAEQRRTIGDVISTALEGASDVADFDVARKIVERLIKRYGTEPRALFEYWNNDKDVSDLFRALGYDAISAAEKSNMKAATWAALDPSIVKLDAQSVQHNQEKY